MGFLWASMLAPEGPRHSAGYAAGVCAHGVQLNSESRAGEQRAYLQEARGARPGPCAARRTGPTAATNSSAGSDGWRATSCLLLATSVAGRRLGPGRSCLGRGAPRARVPLMLAALPARPRGNGGPGPRARTSVRAAACEALEEREGPPSLAVILTHAPARARTHLPRPSHGYGVGPLTSGPCGLSPGSRW